MRKGIIDQWLLLIIILTLAIALGFMWFYGVDLFLRPFR